VGSPGGGDGTQPLHLTMGEMGQMTINFSRFFAIVTAFLILWFLVRIAFMFVTAGKALITMTNLPKSESREILAEMKALRTRMVDLKE
jgi:large-conductance mechanosensitive channel